jgi:DNA-directed RNA polymerase specialized sigma24 family protein
MATTEISTEQEKMWRTFFDDNHADLHVVAETLLRCHVSPERVLRKALSVLETSRCEVTFEQAIHAVIDAAIEHNRETANSPLQAKTPLHVRLRVPGMSQIAMLPWPERAVYFLRGILHYSCEEIGLLLSLSEVQIDQLYKFAAKRIGYESKTTCR